MVPGKDGFTAVANAETDPGEGDLVGLAEDYMAEELAAR